MKKGISPLVAAVMLIAVTMAIAGILAFWATSFTRSTAEGLSNQTKTIQICSQADFSIYTDLYNSTTQTHKIILENTGNIQIKITGIDYIYPDGSIIHKNQTLNLLSGAQLQQYVIQGVNPGYSKYRIYTECPNVYKER